MQSTVPIINEYIVKIASRCNLNCSYCYIYNKGDLTYLKQPKFMSEDTVDHMLVKALQHARSHDQKGVSFTFHGGEPLLAGKNFFSGFVKKTRDVFLPDIQVRFHMQTNGVLLDDDWCRLLTDLHINVGISIDGVREIHDKFRVYHSGKGSFDDVVKGMNCLRKYQPASVISVINIDSDPIVLYENLKQLGVAHMGILLPDATHDSPEIILRSIQDSDEAQYGDWLIRLYDHWQNDTSASRVRIPFFESMARLILGENVGSEMMGRRHNTSLTIQTDGMYEVHDVLKICGDGFGISSMNVFDHEIDELLDTPLSKAFYYSHSSLPGQCEKCPIADVCGGGFVAHRFSGQNGFDNPSVYCRDLMKIITHVQNHILELMPAEVLDELSLYPLNYYEARKMLRTKD